MSSTTPFQDLKFLNFENSDRENLLIIPMIKPQEWGHVACKLNPNWFHMHICYICIYVILNKEAANIKIIITNIA